MAEIETNDAPREQDPEGATEAQDAAAGHTGAAGYAPSTVGSTRTRMQCGGVGQADLDQQRDPTTRSSEKY